MSKFYRVKKDSFLWHKGAILEENGNGYKPINDIWDVTDHNRDEYISSQIIENCPEYFERVYEASKFGKAVFVTKEKAREVAGKYFGGKGKNETNTEE